MAVNARPHPAPAAGMPEGAELDHQLAGRNRKAKVWLGLFQLALILAIVALIALLYKIVNDSFGLVAIENAIDPHQLMTGVQEQRMLAAPNTSSTADHEAIAAGVADSPYAIGFLGTAYLEEHSDALLPIPIDGVAPNAANVQSGAYPLARPLYLYVNQKALKQRPEVAAFADHALRNVNNVIEEGGYFALSEEALAASKAALDTITGGEPVMPRGGELRLAGSSTVFPLSQRLLEEFGAQGFDGTTETETVGTSAGFARLCADKSADIASASRAMTRQEVDFCGEEGVRPVELRIATDALAVVVSASNDFLAGLSGEELRAIFRGAEKWSDVNPAWPDEPIERLIPDADSGTLDFFAGAVFDDSIESLSSEEIILILEQSVSKGVMRRLNREQPLEERSHEQLLSLLNERVIEPAIVASWSATDSILNRAEIEEEVIAQHPDAVVSWRRWLNLSFLTQPQSSVPEQSGIRTAILGSLFVVLLTILFAVPIGIGTAIYLEEYAGHGRLQQLIQTNIDNLAGVPSIIYGILGLAVFVRALEPITSGAAFGVGDATTANGRTVIAAGLTLSLLVLPVVIINAQEAIRAVPRSLREAGYGLGATKWQVVWSHVLSNALPGIFTGTILAISRALGETAPLIVVGASTFITQDPTGPFSKFTVLPMQIYQWTSRPQPEFKHIAAAASLVLLVMLLLINGTAIVLRNKYAKPL